MQQLALLLAVLALAAPALGVPVHSAPSRKPGTTLLDAIQDGAAVSDGRVPPEAPRTADDDEAERAWTAAAQQQSSDEQELPEEAGDSLFPGDHTQPADPALWDRLEGDDEALGARGGTMQQLLNRTYDDGAVLDLSSGYLGPDEVDLTYQLVKTVTDALRAAGVPHWAERATLLGGVRQQGLLPWEAAADLGVEAKLRETVARAAAVLRKAGVCAQAGEALVTLSWCRGPHATSRAPGDRQKHTFPLVRVWLMAWGSDDRLAGAAEAGWPAGCWHARAEFEPLGKLQFGPLTLASGGHPADYLKRCVGSAWQSTAGIRPEEGVLAGDAPAAGANQTDDERAAGEMNAFAAQPTQALLDMLSPDMLRDLVR